MASLSPVVDVLLREFENTPAEAIVTAEGFDDVTDWEWSASPSFPDGVEVTPEGEQLRLAWDLVPDLFPLDLIRYRLDGEIHTVGAWADVPAEAEQITELRADTENKREYTFTVTANGFVEEGGQPVPVSATETYTVQILQQYDTNRDILQEEVDARR
ncbi:MAG: hypothetical protein JJU06_12610 [Ectothiorhodospiraceae bacterium]|nr:hypothetical protein [Ectothiorhodospiraceae bacterium]